MSVDYLHLLRWLSLAFVLCLTAREPYCAEVAPTIEYKELGGKERLYVGEETFEPSKVQKFLYIRLTVQAYEELQKHGVTSRDGTLVVGGPISDCSKGTIRCLDVDDGVLTLAVDLRSLRSAKPYSVSKAKFYPKCMELDERDNECITAAIGFESAKGSKGFFIYRAQIGVVLLCHEQWSVQRTSRCFALATMESALLGPKQLY